MLSTTYSSLDYESEQFKRRVHSLIAEERRAYTTLFLRRHPSAVDCVPGRGYSVLASPVAAFHLQDRALFWQSSGMMWNFSVVLWDFGALKFSYDPELGRLYACDQAGSAGKVWSLLLKEQMVASFPHELQGIAWRPDGLWLLVDGKYWHWI